MDLFGPKRLLFYILLLLLLVGCTTSTDVVVQPSVERVPYRIISGTVFYPNNLYFPSRVQMEITLIATNLSTKESAPIVKQSIRNPQRFPVNFILRYDPRDISVANEYSISVELFREAEEKPYLKAYPLPLPELTGDDNIILELQPL